MSYTTEGITFCFDQPQDGGRLICVSTVHTDRVLQCYVSGQLVDVQLPIEGTAEFFLADTFDTDLILVLAVDQADSRVNYWQDAMSGYVAYANRIHIQTPRLAARYRPGDVWKVYCYPADAVCPDQPDHWEEVFPGGRDVCGYGFGYEGGYGFDAANAVGYGQCYGRGEYGLDCVMLSWYSEPLSPGTYCVAAVLSDACGNDSTAFATTIHVRTYARAASDLNVVSYDKQTGQLRLSFSPSEDLD